MVDLIFFSCEHVDTKTLKNVVVLVFPVNTNEQKTSIRISLCLYNAVTNFETHTKNSQIFRIFESWVCVKCLKTFHHCILYNNTNNGQNKWRILANKLSTIWIYEPIKNSKGWMFWVTQRLRRCCVVLLRGFAGSAHLVEDRVSLLHTTACSSSFAYARVMSQDKICTTGHTCHVREQTHTHKPQIQNLWSITLLAWWVWAAPISLFQCQVSE